MVLQRVRHGQLPLDVEGFGDGAGCGREDVQTIAGEVRSVRWEYADHGQSPPSGHTKSALPEGGR